MNLVEKDCWPKSTTSQLIINGFMLHLSLIFFSSTKERELQRLLQEKDSEIGEMKRELKAKDRKLADKDGVSLALTCFSFIFLSFTTKERQLQRQLQERESEYRTTKDDLEYEINQLKRDLIAKDRKLADKDGVSLALTCFSFIFLSFSSPSQLRRENYSNSFKTRTQKLEK